MTSETRLTIVVPIFNEEENLPELYRRITDACNSLQGVGWKLLYVDDGSTDRSREIIMGQLRMNPRVGVIGLSRNFGHQAALTAGLDHAEGDAVILMDGDLQDPPEVIPELFVCWRAGADVVLAVRKTRAELGIRRIGFAVFYRVIRWMGDIPIQAESGVFGLLDRKAVQAVRKLLESNRFIPGLRSWIGFNQRMVYYDRQSRAAGTPKQSLWKLIRYGMDAILSFSYKPLRLLTLLGGLTMVVALALTAFFVARRLAGIETAQTGFTTLVTLILFFGALQLLSVGLLGEYLARIYDEVKARPLYILKDKIDTGGENS